MKKYISILLSGLIVLGLMAGCGNQEAAETTAPVETEPAIDYSKYYSPWNYDVAAKAKEDGKLHYYFMSNEGVIINPAEVDSTKYQWGDCCLIVFPNGQTMMIDSGFYEFRQVLYGNLQQMGIKELDYLVITHPHSDHQGGAIGTPKVTSDFLDIFKVKQVYHVAFNNPESEADELVKNVCAQKNVPAQFLEQGDSFTAGDVKVTVLWPEKGTSETMISGTPAVNNNSMVLHIGYGEHSAMFAADIYIAGETFCMGANPDELLDVDLLKIPHHGAKTSNSDFLLDTTTPEIAVGTGNRNISDEILTRYTSRDINLLYNWCHGYIHIAVGADGVMTAETTRTEPLAEMVAADATENTTEG